MAQFYQVTSLEELHKLYPNLKIDNLEGIPCMIQDDQVTQYTDAQGQQVIATIEQSGMQLCHNPSSSPQCTSQQSQFVVHQPTQYVIQQMDANESQTTSVQYIQQRQQPIQSEEEIPMVQFSDQSLRCINADIGNNGNSSLQQCVAKQETSPQYLSQVHSVLQQPIQIHQQIQAVDMSGNILVLQDQQQQGLLLNQNKNQELIQTSSETQEQQQQKQQQQILQQQQQQQDQHLQQQPQHIVIQKPPQLKPQHIIQKNNNPQECMQTQILQQNRHIVQNVGQQQQIIRQSQQQIIQPLQYFNQLAVIDNLSNPRAVSIEQHLPSSESLSQQQQNHSQIQASRQKKPIQQPNMPIIQQSEVLIPQRFEISSPLGNVSQNKQKVSQKEMEGSGTPVFIVQKVDNPFMIRQQQSRARFQSPQTICDKLSEGGVQSVSAQNEPEFFESKNEENRQRTSIQPSESQQKMNVAGQALILGKSSSEKNISCSPVKLGVEEQTFESRSIEQIDGARLNMSIPIKSPAPKTQAQEHTESTNDSKETSNLQYQRLANSVEPQSRSLSALPSQVQSPVDRSQIQVPSRGRGIRAPPPRGYQFLTRPRSIQLQTPHPRMPNVDRGGLCRKTKPPRCPGKVGRGGWIPSGSPEQRSASLVKAAVQPGVQTTSAKNEANQVSNEVVEEARMVVLLINGEKKIVKIPCSQNILLAQILQQAGISITSSTPITIEQVPDGTAEHIAVKSSPSNQQSSVAFKPTSTTQVVTVSNSPGTPRSIVTTVQRPRGPPPFSSQTSNIGIIRHRLQFASPRMSTLSYAGSAAATSSESATTQASNLYSSTQQTLIKEEPRFVSGFMAVCPFCGISSLDFNKCIRCRRKLPENVKSQSIFCSKKKKEKANSEKPEESKTDSEEKSSDLFGFEGKDKNNPQQGCDRKKTKPYVKKKKISDEPTEILILSSDEEEESKVKKTNTSASVLSGIKKEPIYTDSLMEAEMTNLTRENNSSEDTAKNIVPGSFTTLHCRTIRIGSYKVQPKERVFLSSKGLRIVLNSLKNETATIIIPISDILKVLVHFGKQIPVIFIYPLPKIGVRIRNLLSMDNKIGPYYDPTSTQEETHKRITLLLEKLTEDNKLAISKIFGQERLEELSEKEANEILIRASPIEMQNTNISRTTGDVRKIMVYPPPPEKGGITLNNQDYACLGEDQFLNDVIIDFYLKYLMLKVLSPSDRNRTHVFSTFFYKRLTTKPKTLRKNDPENDPKLSPAEKRHLRVKGWTKHVNLFEKDFIIVPINEHSHWFLAIICFPGLTGPVRFSDNTPVKLEEVAPKKNTQTVQIGNTTITHIIKSDGNTISLEVDSGSDRDEAEGDQDDLHPSSDEEATEQAEEEINASQSMQIPLLAPNSQPQVTGKELKSKLVKKKPVKEPIKQPCILIFDSLAGASRVRVVATLRDYLKIEYKKKMGQDRDFSKDTIKGAVPKVPQQNNFTDCGLYVLQYVESFFQDPLHDFKLPLKYLQDWFPEEVVSCKRQKLASLIRSLMEEQGLNVEEIGLPVLTFTNGNNPEDEQTRMEDEEMDDEDELNEEEEEMLRNKVQIESFENEDEEDINLEEEEEEEDEVDDDEEEFDEEDDELNEFDDDEELEVGEIPRQWIVRRSSSESLTDSPIKRVRPVVYTTTALVEYQPSDSEEELNLSQNSVEISGSQTGVHEKSSEEKEFLESEGSVVLENRKTVPLTEFQDFESQISCTTIERNLEGKNNESDMVISEGEEIHGQTRETADEEETTFETSTSEESNITVNSYRNKSLDKKSSKSNEVLVNVNENKKVVPDLLKKLVKDKTITVSRKEDEPNSNLFKKHSDVKKFKVRNCDKVEEVEKPLNPTSPPKANVVTYKRPFQTLKSVRIPKKAERNLELYSKRQKVDET